LVKVTIKPWQEIIIHEVIQHDIKDLLKLKGLGYQSHELTLPLMWAEGVVFSRVPMPTSTDIIKEQLQGIIHYSSVEFASLPKYQAELKWEGVSIPVIDVSTTEALNDVAKEISKLVIKPKKTKKA
jgi:hypothetical protein